MGFNTFRNDPKSYLQSHTMSIGQNAAVFPPLTAGGNVPIPGGGTKRQYTHNTGQYLDMVFQLGHNATIQVAEEKEFLNRVARKVGLAPRVSPVMRYAAPIANGGGDNGLRFLPYELGYCTYMALDNAATFAITGPLTGCTVGVGQVGGNIYLFHSFTPNGFVGNAARARQSAMINNVRLQLGINVVHTAVNTVDYNGQAFVFGRISKGHWKFYAYGLLSGLRKIAEF